MRLPAIDPFISLTEGTEPAFYGFDELVNRPLLLFAGMPAYDAFPAEFGHHTIFLRNLLFNVHKDHPLPLLNSLLYLYPYP